MRGREGEEEQHNCSQRLLQLAHSLGSKEERGRVSVKGGEGEEGW